MNWLTHAKMWLSCFPGYFWERSLTDWIFYNNLIYVKVSKYEPDNRILGDISNLRLSVIFFYILENLGKL